MRIGIISDVHGNYYALRAVLEHMGGIDALWCLGDLVGYGPQPNECVTTVSQFPHLCVPGNHDWGTLGRLDRQAFNRDARMVLEWTFAKLTSENITYLDSLPVMMPALPPNFTMVHASPRNPMWEYLLDLFDAAECFPLFDTRYLFVGHTHVPLVFRELYGSVKASVPDPGEIIRLNIGPLPKEYDQAEVPRMIINPGSVGQPRDGDARASYMMLELPDDLSSGNCAATLTYWRIGYPVKKTQALMKDFGFPTRLIARIELGV